MQLKFFGGKSPSTSMSPLSADGVVRPANAFSNLQTHWFIISTFQGKVYSSILTAIITGYIVEQ
jgi:hypothetical protein